MKVIRFHESEEQEHWLEEIKRSDWRAGAYLYELLKKGRFFEEMGESSHVLLLTQGEELISFCTYSETDAVRPTELTPWAGFVYTFPEHRGRRCAGRLFEEIERLAKEEGVPEVYLSTDHVGLYEKYGFRYLREGTDQDGKPTRIYGKSIG